MEFRTPFAEFIAPIETPKASWVAEKSSKREVKRVARRVQNPMHGVLNVERRAKRPDPLLKKTATVEQKASWSAVEARHARLKARRPEKKGANVELEVPNPACHTRNAALALAFSRGGELVNHEMAHQEHWIRDLEDETT